MAFFVTMASAFESAQASLAPPVVLTIARALRIHALGFRCENGAQTKSKAVV